MSLSALPACLAFAVSFSHAIAIVIPVAALILAGVIVVSALYFQNRRRELWHETARLALEKGQPLPAIPDEDATSAQRQREQDDGTNDFRAGLILLGTGIGLFFFLGRFVKHELGYVGAVPGFIGLGLLLFGILRLVLKRPANENRPTQP
jgi:hypothetical protein